MHHSLFKDKVVIIGGGQAGTALARVLSKKLDRSQHDLVLINPRPFDVWLPGLVRAAVTGDNKIDEVNKGIFTSYGELSRQQDRMKDIELTVLSRSTIRWWYRQTQDRHSGLH